MTVTVVVIWNVAVGLQYHHPSFLAPRLPTGLLAKFRSVLAMSHLNNSAQRYIYVTSLCTEDHALQQGY